MKVFLPIVTLFVFMSFTVNRQSFYAALSSDSKVRLTSELEKLNKTKASPKQYAYKGTVLMKLSQYEKTPKSKLDKFKKGKDLLEKQISDFPKNCEFRFLRLIIQENCPKMLKYSNNINEDIEHIYHNFNSQDKLLQGFIRDYSKNSKNISSSKLK